MTTLGAFLRRLADFSFTLTLPVPLKHLVLTPETFAVPASLTLALVPAGGIAVMVQTIVLPSAERSQVTRTLGASPLSPFGPAGPGAPVGPVGPGAPVAPGGPAGAPAPAAPPAPPRPARP